MTTIGDYQICLFRAIGQEHIVKGRNH